VRVVDVAEFFGHVRRVGDLQRPVELHGHAPLAVRPERHRLPVFQPDLVLGRPRRLLSQEVERPVVEDIAVLVDLDEGRSLVGAGGPQHVQQVLAVVVDRAGHERGFGPQRQRHRVEGMVERTERGRLRDLPLLAGRRILALRQPVDLIVEQDDLQVHVAAECVDQVIAADRQRVPIAGHDPHRRGRGGRWPVPSPRPERVRGSNAPRRCPCSTRTGHCIRSR